MKKQILALFIAATTALSLSACEFDLFKTTKDIVDAGKEAATQVQKEVENLKAKYNSKAKENQASQQSPVQLDTIPAFSDSPYVEINGNKPFFETDDYTTSSFEFYSDLDELGRCGVCYACVGSDIMPTEERGEIGMVKPSGWHTVRYDDVISDKYLYNRCHLIGFQLTGENANVKNLITGTRYLNVTGMLPLENEVADYVHSTDNHVLYRVTPIFESDNLVANGVLMEAYSVEDNGKGVCFNVYCYNAQPHIEIDYATGESKKISN